jgi:capsular polysaccharide biosynthesis protein
LDGPPNDWQEGPSLVESIRHYRWLVVVAVLVGGVAAYLWSSTQPVRYQGVVRVYLDTGGSETVDPGRIVRSQAEFITSPQVLDRTVALVGGGLTRKELEQQLTVEPARDADLITIRVLAATRPQAADLANTVVRAYRESVAKQANDAARQEVATNAKRQVTLEREIIALTEQLRSEPSNPRLQANLEAKNRQLEDLANQSEAARREAARATRRAESLQETATVPDEPAQPKPLRTAVMGALLAAVAAAALAWWLYGRRYTPRRQRFPGRALAGAAEEDRAGVELGSPLRMASPFRDGQAASANGAPATAGTTSGIADFDQIATSVQELSRFLEGPTQRLYEEDLPQLAAEEIAHRFQVDLAAILLDNAGEVQTMGSVGLRAGPTSSTDRGVRHLIEAAARSGPRLVEPDELVRLASTGLGGNQADSLALVPLVRDEVGFGVLVAGRRRTDERVAPLSEREVQEIADCTRDIVPYLWAWLLLRVLKLRLRTLQ